MTEFRVRALMQSDHPVLNERTPIRQAVAVLTDSNVAAAPVLDDGGALVGILTQRDCFRPALHASYHREWTGRVSDHMTREVVAVDSEDEVMRVAEMFIKHPHRVFPVVDGNNVAGMLRRSDVLAFLVKFG